MSTGLPWHPQGQQPGDQEGQENKGGFLSALPALLGSGWAACAPLVGAGKARRALQGCTGWSRPELLLKNWLSSSLCLGSTEVRPAPTMCIFTYATSKKGKPTLFLAQACLFYFIFQFKQETGCIPGCSSPLFVQDLWEAPGLG